ncbi:MAG TPA: hypothetical protein VJB90_04405 [Candidatus Nanoarchaeia archaeon]|nr:hypothetical protein [Candidatus Nanoarchaeia archaeon]
MNIFRNTNLNLDRRSLFIIIFGLISILILFMFFRVAFFVIFLVLLNLAGGFVVSRQRMVLNMFGFEFVTFSTIFAGFAFGPVIGVIIGVLGRLCEAVSMKHNFSLAVTLPMYAGLGFLAGIIHPSNVVAAGIMMAIAFSIIGSAMTFVLLQGRPFTMAVFTTTQIIFNFLLISYLFPIFFTLVKI